MFLSKPLGWLSNLPDRFIQTLTTTYVIVYSLPTLRGIESLRHCYNIELFGEFKIIRIELLKDFIVEPMLAAKFPYPLPTVSLGIY